MATPYQRVYPTRALEVRFREDFSAKLVGMDYTIDLTHQAVTDPEGRISVGLILTNSPRYGRSAWLTDLRLPTGEPVTLDMLEVRA